MCGLFGVASFSLSKRERDAFKVLAMVSQFRGIDSTGVLAVGKHKKEYINTQYKSVECPSLFLSDVRANNLITDSKFNTLIGHNRAATLGSINYDNAQPVCYEHIAGVHNGTIIGYGNKTLDISDSRDLYERIATYGYEDTLKEVNNKNGAYALVWYDANDDLVRIIRNDKRPLWYGKNAGALMWASERIFLEFATNYLNLYTKTEWVKLEENTLLTFDPAHPVSSLKEQKVLGVKKTFFPVVGYGTSGGGDTKEEHDDYKALWESELKEWEEEKKREREAPLEQEEKKVKVPVSTNTKKEVYDRFEYSGYMGRHLPLKDAENILNDGCSNCDTPLQLADRAHFFTRNEFLCDTCVGSTKDTLINPHQLHVGKLVRKSKHDS